ncbi:MAG: phosphopantetheine-binding protein, partial [Acidobacteria bacterium]|nr:phosphopantetheine-binding protein [Acidobacteriota bacterium]
EAYLDDLGAESLDFLEITMDAESEFGISMPEKDILQMAQEVFGPGVLENESILTEEGKKFILRRVSELDPKQLEGEIRVADLTHHFSRVATWVRMIRGLMESTPHQCSQCGSAFGKGVAGRMKCTQCEAECDIPLGDDLNRQWIEEYYRNEFLPKQKSGD